jgi:GTPase SAR1 family protein
MQLDTQQAETAEKLSAAFEHSITWEDDIWRADPVDVEQVHQKARRKYYDLLDAVTADRKAALNRARILLFHGQSGAGKTHLIRALRTGSHRSGKAYFGYAQMTPDVGNYADYFLRRLVHSLEKPYDPDKGGESGLKRLTRKLIDSAGLTEEDREQLAEAPLDETKLARLVLRLADDVLASAAFRDEDLDANLVRALLYLERRDPRIDQRIRQYLNGRPLTDLAREAVAAIDPNTGEDRTFEIISSLGRLMWIVDGAALVFAIDQVEDLTKFDDPEVRFQRAIGDLMQIANRVPTSIILISCLEDFYGRVREPLAQSYRDRIEKAGPVALYESRTAEEARLIIARRLENEAEKTADGPSFPDASAFFGPEFFEEFAGLSTRRLLEHAQNRLLARTAPANDDPELEKPSFFNSLVAALGLGAADNDGDIDSDSPAFDYRELWDRFLAANEAEIPSNDDELIDVLVGAINLAKHEWRDTLTITVDRLDLGEELPALDVSARLKSGQNFDARVFLCNRATQGGGLKRQLDRVLRHMKNRTCLMLRASDFPPNRKNQTAQSFRQFRDAGGRQLLVPIPDWERMIALREFHAHHRFDAGFASWFEQAKLVSQVLPVSQILRLDMVQRSVPRADAVGLPFVPAVDGGTGSAPAPAGDLASVATPNFSDWTGLWSAPIDGAPANDDELPLSVILDENGNAQNSIVAGRELGPRAAPVRLNRDVLKRHAAVLGGSGSGKTTLALSLIEQLLLRNIPAVLIDRKGDLASYANPDVWRHNESELLERRGEREKLADAIDVAVYTPGRASGRPISITLLPNGICELPEHEQQLLANLSAAALGDMLHLKNSATHQKQGGVLAVALRILGAQSNKAVTLSDLIHLLEDEDPELTDLTQRMDPSGKIRRDLVAQLDSLRHRNAALFDGSGEPLRMEALLGLGEFARPGRTRLSVIYTGFLGDNENILFWVSQFLSEALRFCQRNPNDELQAVVMFDEADLYIPANSKPATAEPLQSLLKRARSAGLGLMLATQSPGDLDYKSRDQITSWFIGRVREDTALRKLKAAFQSESGLDPAAVLPGQTVGEFHLVQEGHVRPMKAQRSLIDAEQVPFDRIEQLAHETKGQDERQLPLFDVKAPSR